VPLEGVRAWASVCAWLPGRTTFLMLLTSLSVTVRWVASLLSSRTWLASSTVLVSQAPVNEIHVTRGSAAGAHRKTPEVVPLLLLGMARYVPTICTRSPGLTLPTCACVNERVSVCVCVCVFVCVHMHVCLCV
jgi:hypothetical protein